jgi:hypothetical protein
VRNFLRTSRSVASVRFLISYHDGKFTSAPDTAVQSDGIRISPALRAPRANAICERITGILRGKLSSRLLIVNKHHLRWVLTEYLCHYTPAAPCPWPARTPTRPLHINRAEHEYPDPPATSPEWVDARTPDRRPNSLVLPQDEAGHRRDRVFEPNTLERLGVIARPW